jgi:hypothetical protein
MIAVGHKRVVAAIVAALACNGRTAVGICGSHPDGMIVVVALVGVVQVAVVQIVHVPVVLDAQMAAVLAVDVAVVAVNMVIHGLALCLFADTHASTLQLL